MRLTKRGRRVVWVLETIAIAVVVWFVSSLDGIVSVLIH
jgi:hypothetical protein